MKTIKYLNTFAIGLPFFILITYFIYKDNSIFWALYSTMVTGFIQVTLSIFLLIKNPKDKFILGYLASVVLFLLLWYFNDIFLYSTFLIWTLIAIPPILAIYLSCIIYKQKKDTK